jgi:DNA-binding Lrp family transcriptional regulator
MKDGGRRTLREIAARIGGNIPEASISARLRDLRKLGYQVERRPDPVSSIPGFVRVYSYRVIRG